jgi:hypothetical protein
MTISTSVHGEWSAGARSVAEFSGDCLFSFSVPASVSGIAIGLNSLNASSQPEEIQHGFLFTGNTYYVVESGIRRTAPATIGTSFSIRREAGVVTYFADDALLYTSLTPSRGTVFLDASMFGEGDSVSAAEAVELYTATVSAAFRPMAVSASDSGDVRVFAEFAPMSVSAIQGAFVSASFAPMSARAANGVIISPSGVSIAIPPLQAYSEGGLWPGVTADLPPIQVAAFGPGAPIGVTARFPRIIAFATAGEVSNSVQLLLPAITSELPSFGSASIVPPSPTLYAVGRSSAGDFSAHVAPPSPTMAAYAGANASITAPGPSLSITATVTGFGAASISAPSPVIAALGTVSTLGSADLFPPIPTIVGYSGAVIDITMQDGMQLHATGVTGAIGRASLTLPLFELAATGTMENYGGADLLAPMPALGGQGQAWIQPVMAYMEAIGTATVMATFEAYAVNLQHTADADGVTVDEVTRYTNFPFTHVVRYKNSYFGANSTGLYLLEGTTDAGTAIPYEIETHPDTFGHPGMKTAVSAYLSGRIDPELTAKIVAGQDAPQTYSYASPRGATAQTHRVKFGRGVKDRYLAVGLAGHGVLELDEIELEIDKHKRRI